METFRDLGMVWLYDLGGFVRTRKVSGITLKILGEAGIICWEANKTQPRGFLPEPSSDPIHQGS